MKTKTKKCGILAALAAVLLVSAVLITSCPEALDPGGLTVPKAKERVLFDPPPGMGFILLDVDVEKFSARTTMPDVSAFADVTDFGKLEVYISGGAGTYTQPADATWDGSATFTVDQSATDYTVTVLGYDKTTPTPVAIAAGTKAITVDDTAKEVEITLKEITFGQDHASTGTLALNLTNPGGVTTAQARVINLSTGATNSFASYASVLPVATPTTYTLQPGYYRLELNAARTGYQSATYREIIVIWSGLTTTYARDLELISMLHPVTYYYRDERGLIDPSPPATFITENFVHNTDFTHPGGGSAPSYLKDDGDPDLDKIFAGWWTGTIASDVVTYLTEWHTTGGSITKVIRPQTLYAKWNTAGPATLTVTPSVGWSVGKVTNITASTDQAGLVSTTFTGTQTNLPTIYFTVNAAWVSSNAGVAYTWEYAGIDESGGVSTTPTSITPVALTDDKIIMIDFKQSPYNAKGTHVFYLEIYDPDATPAYENGIFTVEIDYE